MSDIPSKEIHNFGEIICRSNQLNIKTKEPLKFRTAEREVFENGKDTCNSCGNPTVGLIEDTSFHSE